MKILICGASGFLGKNLVERLSLEGNNELVLLDTYFDEKCLSLIKNTKYQIVNDNSVKQLIDIKFDLVFYLSCVSNPSTALTLSEEFTNNIEPLIDALELCSLHKTKFIYFSSGGTVYGNNGLEANNENSALMPISSYGLQKCISEKVVEYYGCNKGINYNIVRIANPYGQYQNPKGSVGAITKFVYQCLSSETITIFGDGKNERDYIYVKDAVDMICMIAFSKKNGIYNIGTGKGTSLVKIIECLNSIFGQKVNVSFEQSRLCDVRKNVLDISKFISDFGPYHFTELDEGILKTINYLKGK